MYMWLWDSVRISSVIDDQERIMDSMLRPILTTDYCWSRSKVFIWSPLSWSSQQGDSGRSQVWWWGKLLLPLTVENILALSRRHPVIASSSAYCLQSILWLCCDCGSLEMLSCSHRVWLGGNRDTSVCILCADASFWNVQIRLISQQCEGIILCTILITWPFNTSAEKTIIIWHHLYAPQLFAILTNCKTVWNTEACFHHIIFSQWPQRRDEAIMWH